MEHASEAKSYLIQAAVLRKRGGPLAIESLEMDAPREDEVAVGCHREIRLVPDKQPTKRPARPTCKRATV